MSDILQDFPIQAAIEDVFRAISTPEGLDRWWTKNSAGEPRLGAEYVLGFGPEYDWRARVTRCEPNAEFELELTRADPDWLGSRVGFRMETRGARIWLRFRHMGWPSANEHYRVSCHCWALYLRILRRALESGESVPYERRLEA